MCVLLKENGNTIIQVKLGITPIDDKMKENLV